MESVVLALVSGLVGVLCTLAAQERVARDANLAEVRSLVEDCREACERARAHALRGEYWAGVDEVTKAHGVLLRAYVRMPVARRFSLRSRRARERGEVLWALSDMVQIALTCVGHCGGGEEIPRALDEEQLAAADRLWDALQALQS